MKTLEFDVRGQSLKLVKPRMGSKGGYLNTRFQLDGKYDDAEKVIVSFGDQRGEGEMAFELGPSDEQVEEIASAVPESQDEGVISAVPEETQTEETVEEPNIQEETSTEETVEEGNEE